MGPLYRKAERTASARLWSAGEASRFTLTFPSLTARILAALLIALPLAAEERTLRWASLDVVGRLGATGEMHLSERHTMVWDGDWNGGERQFGVAPGQRLEFVAISRVDPATGTASRLTAGAEPDIDLDEFAWADGWRLRWRSRRPTDPPFRDHRLVYVIEYRLFPVLVHTPGDKYVLTHDFAFAERPGVIEKFGLDFHLDRSWRPPRGFGYRVERPRLSRGQSVLLSAPFTWAGEGQPEYVVEQAPRAGTRAGALKAGLGSGGGW